MTANLWLEIPNWDRFQHYSDRNPVWLKTYIAQLDDPDYQQLTFAQRGLLHDLRLLYARSHRTVRLHTPSVTRALSGRTLSTQLIALNHAGFIRLSASKPLAQTRQKSGSYEPDIDSAASKMTTKTPLVDTLLGEIRDADDRTIRYVRSFQSLLPEAAFARALESLRHRRAHGQRLTSEARYVVAALATMKREGIR